MIETLSPLAMKLLYMIQQKPRTHQIELCRAINGKWKFYCGRKTCFANIRKRRYFRIAKPDCQIRRGSIAKVLKQLEKAGLIEIHRLRKADGRNNRGWDYFMCHFSTLKVWIA